MRKFFTPTEDLDAIMILVLQAFIGGSVLMTFLRTIRCVYVSVFKKESIKTGKNESNIFVPRKETTLCKPILGEAE